MPAARGGVLHGKVRPRGPQPVSQPSRSLSGSLATEGSSGLGPPCPLLEPTGHLGAAQRWPWAGVRERVEESFLAPTWLLVAATHLFSCLAPISAFVAT